MYGKRNTSAIMAFIIFNSQCTARLPRVFAPNRDTVASVGVFSRHLPFTASNTIIRTFRQALALDEHRAKFKPNPWHRAAASVAAARNDPDKGTCVIPPSARPNFFERISSGMREEIERVGDVMQNVMGDVMEGKMYKRQGGRNVLKKRSVKSVDSEAIDDGDDDAYHGKRETDVKEVWFPGMFLVPSPRPVGQFLTSTH